MKMKWIWTSADDSQADSYRDFRRTFICTSEDLAGKVSLDISADSLYDVFINGKRIPITQFSDFALEKTVSHYDITGEVKPGVNTVAVCLFYIKKRFSTYTPGEPGLALRIARLDNDETIAETDDSWKWRNDPCYVSGREVTVSAQLGFASEYDSRNEDGWKSNNYDDSNWQFAYVQTDIERHLLKRPAPFLAEYPPCPVAFSQIGELKRDGERETPADTCQFDWLFSDVKCADMTPDASHSMTLTWPLSNTFAFKPLAHTNANGHYLIMDLGKETVGYLKVVVEATAGTVLDICHGEHLNDGRVRVHIGYRHFCDRYICHDGVNEFTHTLRRIGARYIELHVTGETAPVKVQYLGVIPVELPLPPLGAFELDDQLFKRTYDVALDTLKLCMHEHYEDCPWREQSLYAYDSRNQILYGYYNWGNYDFAAASLDLLGRSYFGNGDIGITAPSKDDGTTLQISCFTLVWISELYEHYLHSGSIGLFQRFQDTVWDIFQKVLARKEQDGKDLYRTNDTKYTWNFYEWTDNLGNQKEFPQSPYNIYLYEAMISASKMYSAIGNGEKSSFLKATADRIAACINESFWDDDAKCYSTLLPGKVTNNEHVQAVMLYNGIVPVERKQATYEALTSGKLVPISYSAFAYYVRGLMAGTPEMRAGVEPFLNAQFNGPILQGATSLWETAEGAGSFDWAGSLCHAWSSIHAYYAKCYLLGVAPAEPGFATFTVKPYPGRHAYASGEIPTPKGFIRVEWTRNGKVIDLDITAPQGLKPIVECYPEYELGKVAIH